MGRRFCAVRSALAVAQLGDSLGAAKAFAGIGLAVATADRVEALALLAREAEPRHGDAHADRGRAVSGAGSHQSPLSHILPGPQGAPAVTAPTGWLGARIAGAASATARTKCLMESMNVAVTTLICPTCAARQASTDEQPMASRFPGVQVAHPRRAGCPRRRLVHAVATCRPAMFLPSYWGTCVRLEWGLTDVPYPAPPLAITHGMAPAITLAAGFLQASEFDF